MQGLLLVIMTAHNKHKTIIEDDAFIGSNCELVAPVTVGKGATLAAGTTLTKDAPAGALTLTKKVISEHYNWTRPRKAATQRGNNRYSVWNCRCCKPA